MLSSIHEPRHPLATNRRSEDGPPTMTSLRDESTEHMPGPGGAPSSDPTEDHDSQRLEAFSDGVIAIAITLLVLELKVPHDVSRPLAAQLLEEWPAYAAYLVSFATIGILWLNHHRLFTMVRRVDQPLLVWNGLLLLGISVVPFPTALVAARLGHEGERLATGVYTGLFVYLALVFNGLWRYASSPRRDPQLLHL